MSDTGSWGPMQRAFAPDYRRNWRSFMGQGFHGDTKEYEWDPDDASDITVHRNKALSGNDWNFTEYETQEGTMPMTGAYELY